MVWLDYSLGTHSGEIFFAASRDAGHTFNTPKNLSNKSTSNSEHPQISTEGNNVYVVWDEHDPVTFASEVYFSKSNNNGENFSAPENLSNSEGNAGVYVAWNESSGNNSEIFFV